MPTAEWYILYIRIQVKLSIRFQFEAKLSYFAYLYCNRITQYIILQRTRAEQIRLFYYFGYYVITSQV